MTQNEFNPYVGPRPFERKKEDSARFFGRAQETEEIVSLIFGHPVILVYAQSGAGKTSLFNASVAVKLEENGFDVLPLTRVGGVVPKGVALQEIKNLYVFNSLLKMDSETDPKTLLSTSLSTFLETRTHTTDDNDQPRPRVMIFDQFEELFTYTPEHWREQRDGFFLQVVDALNADPLLRVVFVIREDFLAELDPYSRILPERLRTRYRLERMGKSAALRAIKDPLANTSRKFAVDVAEGLAGELLKMKTVDATGKAAEIEGQYIEPVQLQVVCVTLWSGLEPEVTEIEKAHLKNFNVNDALSNFYKSAIESAARETSVTVTDLRNWFGKTLITPMGTRSTVFRGEDSTGGINNSAVDFLEGLHIIRAEFRAGARWYELTHDRLVEPILASNRKWLEALSPLQQQAALWKDHDKQESWLFSDQTLVEVEHWANDHADELSDLDGEFINACRKKQDDKDQQQKLLSEQKLVRQRRLVTNISIGVTTVMVALAIFAFIQARRAGIEANKATVQTNIALTAKAEAEAKGAEAEANRIEAEKQAHVARGNELAVQSQTVFENNNQLSLLLALESLEEAQQGGASRLPLAEDVLRRAIGQVGSGTPLNGHAGRVSSVVISPNGNWLASGSDDSTVRLWNITASDPSANPFVFYTDSCQVITLVFSPDDKWLAGGCNDYTVRLWDMDTFESSVFFGHTDYVYSLAFSPNSKWLASGSRDNTIRLWDMKASDPAANSVVFTGHIGLVLTLAFSPNGNWLASGSADATVRLWDMTALDPSVNPRVLNGHTGVINILAFSKNGDWLASGSEDATVRVWRMNIQDPAVNPIVLDTNASTVLTLAFSPKGDRLAAGGSDAVLRLWNIDSQTVSSRSIALNGHSDWIRKVAFSSNGKWLASSSDDSTVRLWDMTVLNPSDNSIVLREHNGYVYSLAFSPDGHWLVSAGDDATPRLWDISAQSEVLKPEQEIASYELIASLPGHSNEINALSFSLDGNQLASASDDATVRLWNFQAGLPSEDAEALQSANRSGPVNTLLYWAGLGEWTAGSGDNKLLTLGLVEGSLVEEDISLAGHKGAISILTINESLGLYAVPNNTNHSVELWNGDLTKVPSLLEGHKGAIHSMAFSPDNRWLASAGGDASIILWSLKDLQNISHQILQEHTGDINMLAFSSNGRWLASAGSDSTVRLWDFSKGVPSQATYILRGHKESVRALAFSPGGRWLASAGDDSSIRLWDMSSLFAPPVVLKGSGGSISALAFSPNGRWLVGGGSDANLHIWGTEIEILISQACKIARRNLTWQEWREYFKNNSYHVTCADFAVHPSAADHFISPGDKAAHSGDIEGAIAKYQEALKNCPENLCPGFSKDYLPDPAARANNQAALALLEEGDTDAQNDNIEAAIKKYEDALKFDSTIIPDSGSPESRALNMYLESLSELDFEELVTRFVELQTDDPDIVDLMDDPILLNNICWWGSIYGQPSNVREACEKVVGLDPNDGGTVDSRGLNRALLGDYAGAIADFEFAVKWFRENQYEEHYAVEREAWIVVLKNNQNPFDDPANMEIVRNE